jgi:protein LTV1
VTFQLVSRGYGDLLSGDPDAPQNVLEHIPNPHSASSSSHHDPNEESEELDEEEDGDMIVESVESDEEATDDAYDYSQHMMQVGSSPAVGFSVFVHKNGTIVPTATLNKDESVEAPSDSRLKIDKKSIKEYESRSSGASTSSKAKEDVGRKLGLDASLFAARSEAADEEGRFMQKFGNIATDAFVDPEIMEELEEAMQAAGNAEELDEGLPDNFISIANASDSDDDYGESGDDDDDGNYADDLDVDIDDDVDDVAPNRKRSKSHSTTAAEAPKPRPTSEQAALLEEQFQHELEKFDEDDSDLDDDDEDVSQFKGATDIAAFEGMLDEFLEQRSKTFSDGWDSRPTDQARKTLHRSDSDDEGDNTSSYDDEDEDSSEGVDPNVEATEVIVVPISDSRYNNDDCESVLSSYTNTENHPRLLDAASKPPRILFDKRGIPSVAADAKSDAQKPKKTAPATQPRKKDESVEERRARKQAIKEERRQNRARKKETKMVYRQEENVQKKLDSRRTTVVHY